MHRSSISDSLHPFSGLGIDGTDAQKVCASLTAEREDVRVRREELLKKLERLEAASQELAAYR